MKGNMDEKQKRKMLLLAAVIVIGILLILLDNASLPESPSVSAPAFSSNAYSSAASVSSDCFRCNDTGICPDCRGLKDCQYVYGASHHCVNGLIYYGGDMLLCSSCDGTGKCDTCKGTGLCPWCR